MPQAANATEQRDLPPQVRAATIEPSTFNPDTNEVEVVWTTGARVRRYDWWTEQPYEEELVITEDAVDMARFDAGTVQVLDGHRSYGGVGAILGIATRAWVANGEGRALIRLSERPELAGIVADIRSGVIRAISFGYTVQRYEITRAQDRTDGVNMALYRAVRFTPNEISFVPVPADANAGTRSQEAPRGGMPCEFIRAAAHNPQQEPSMPQTANAATGGANTPAQPDADALRAEAQAAERQRSADITALCQRHGVPNLAADMIRNGQTVDQARAAVLDELARNDAAAGGHRNVQVQTVSDEHETRLRGIEEAVANRVDARAQLTENGRQYRGLTLLELGREMLQARGVNVRGMDRLRLATEMLHFRSGGGMHSTSDFANLMSNVANRRLRGAYEANPGTYALWARRAPNAPDFKAINVVQLADAPDLVKTNEHGEFTYGTAKDGAETYAVATYGRIVSLTRQAIINDDLRGFDRLVGAFGNSARRLENRLVYSQLTANAALSDGTALFHANHGNLGAGAGSALQFSALAAGRTAMRVQKGLQSEELNIAPAFLIVPAALEQTAYQLTSSNYVPAKQADVNEFRAGGRTALEAVVEPILDGNSATAWYLAANNGAIDTVEYCYLDGAEGPVIESEVGFETDGISYRCRLDFAAKAVDYRGLYKGVGA